MSEQKTKTETAIPYQQLATRGGFTPRHADSRQWTDLPIDFLSKIKDVFVRQFDLQAQHGDFIVEGRIYPREAVIRVGYLEKGRLKQINFEASIDLNEQKAHGLLTAEESSEQQSQVMDRLYTCIDSLGSLMEEYFNLGDDELLDIPFQWMPLEFEGEILHIQQSSLNSRLEDEADRILGLKTEALFQQAPENEDALANAEIDSELAFGVQEHLRKKAREEGPQ